ncbi:MAG: lytic transglycosylase domain-containing protein [Deltaproteobacteria bacterium]|nr:lytic transglycosylase domain-containing protein [Deltaproteobacteria bacterium]
MARDRSPEALPEGAEPVRRRPAEPENLLKDVIKPASLALPPLPAPAAVAPALPSPSPGAGSHGVAGVRRYRDSQGVIHLVSTPRPAGEDRGPPGWGPLPPNVASAELCQLPGPPEIAPLSFSKDSQGTLRLTNARAAPDWRRNRAKNLEAILAEASFWYGLPVPLIEALIKVESNFAASAVSPKGAMGLMQLMPGTAKDMGVTNPFCPRQNVLGGCRYLRMLLDACQRSLPLALAAYNAGYRRVADSGFKVPNIEETQAFVTQVLGHYYLAQKQKTRASTQLRL